MTSGYLSREAVNDLLAIKEGEKDFLKAKNAELQQRITFLEEQLALLKAMSDF
jgi:cell division protein FtsB